MQLNINEKVVLASILDEDSSMLDNVDTLISSVSSTVKNLVMKLRKSRKDYSQTYQIKTLFLKAYAVLWNQTNSTIREIIAKHFAKKICDEFQVSDKTLYPNLENFFAESMLQVKIDIELFKKIYQEAHLIKPITLRSIECMLEQPTQQCLDQAFKPDSTLRSTAVKISNLKFNSLRKWVDKYPYEGFYDKAGSDKIIQDAVFFRRSAVVSTLILYCILTYNEDKRALFHSFLFVLSLFLIWSWPKLVESFRSEGEAILNNIHFNLIDIDEEQNFREKKPRSNRSTQPFNRPALTIQSRQTQLEVGSDSREEIYEKPTPKKEKIKTRPASDLAAAAEIVGEEKISVPTVQPDYFGEVYRDLLPIYFTLIDRKNLGRNNSYFAIWDNPSIHRYTKNQSDEDNCSELLKVFGEGKIATRNSRNGIKFLSGIGFFEIQKTGIGAKVSGDREVTEKGKKAIIFEQYSRVKLG